MNEFLKAYIVPAIYLLSAVLFIFGLKLLGRVRTARKGNFVSASGMALAIIGTLLELGIIDYRWILVGMAIGSTVGAILAIRVAMTSMPEMVALLNGFGGLASTLVALSYYWNNIGEAKKVGTIAEIVGSSQAASVGASIIIGGVTFSGSVIAYLQLQGKLNKGRPVLLPARHATNILLFVAAIALAAWFGFWAPDVSMGIPSILGLTVLCLVLGVLLVIPIGGADMPVVISLLNSYSGLAAAATGFIIANNVLIITGALVGASGIILSQIMCVAMNRSLASVLIGGFGTEASASGGNNEYGIVRSCGPEEAAMLLENATSLIVVPGYGLAVAQAQHAVRELADFVQKRGTRVSYAIHPVAGRMPGHMNVLLAEADVPYEQLVEMDQINPDFKNTDVVLVVGANDVVNPAALTNKDSPIYGMPILEVHNARTVFVIKRSLGSGYAGVKNELFERENTMMIYGDAKKVLQSLVNELKQAA